MSRIGATGDLILAVGNYISRTGEDECEFVGTYLYCAKHTESTVGGTPFVS